MTDTRSGARTLAVLYPGCIEYEVTTPDGSDHAGSDGMTVRSGSAFAAVEARAFQVVLIPGRDVEAVFDDDSLFGLLRDAHAAGALVGAICAGPIPLGRAGLLAGRRFTHGMKGLYSEVLQPIWQTGTFEDSLIVTDDRIITAKPEGHIDFGVEVAMRAGAVAAEKAEAVKRYYKGLGTGPCSTA